MDNLNSGRIKFERFNCNDVLSKYKCKKCEFTSDLWIIVNDHMWRCHQSFHDYCKTDPNLEIYTCGHCNSTTNSLLLWYRHRRRCTPLNHQTVPHDGDVMTQNRTSSKRCFRCDLCEYTSDRGDRLRIHYLRYHTDPKYQVKYKCNQCSFETLDTQTLKSHIFRIHQNMKWYKCKHCEYKTQQYCYYRTHLLRHTHQCNHCSFETYIKTKLEMHNMRVHVNPKEIEWFRCDYCKYKVKIKYYLKEHIWRKHKIQVSHERKQKTVSKVHTTVHHTNSL